MKTTSFSIVTRLPFTTSFFNIWQLGSVAGTWLIGAGWLDCPFALLAPLRKISASCLFWEIKITRWVTSKWQLQSYSLWRSFSCLSFLSSSALAVLKMEDMFRLKLRFNLLTFSSSVFSSTFCLSRFEHFVSSVSTLAANYKLCTLLLIQFLLV